MPSLRVEWTMGVTLPAVRGGGRERERERERKKEMKERL